jgi:mannose-6-phosphate isomerase-like protein (cupin superfamily)
MSKGVQVNIRNVFQPRRLTRGRHPGRFDVNWIYEKGDFVSPLHHVATVTVPPGGAIGEHLHDGTEELYLILEGSGLVYVDGTVTRVKRGDLILTGPGHSHRLDNDGDSPVLLIAINSELG